MKRIKKIFTTIISMVLVVAMVGTSCVFADTSESNDKNHNLFDVQTGDSPTFTYNGHGEFVLTDNVNQDSSSNQRTLSTVKLGEKVSAKSLDNENLFYIGNDKYLINADENIYTLSDRLVIDYMHPEESFEKYADYDISDELKDAVLREIEEQDGEFSENYSIELYIPSKTYPKDSNSPKSDPGAGDTSVSSYTFNGYTLKTSVIKVTGDKDLINTYVDAFGIALNFISLVLSFYQGTGLAVTLFGAGISAYGLYSSMYGNVGSGSNDYLHLVMSYTQYKKLTSVYYTYIWEPGVYSQKIILGQLAATERFGDCLNYLQRTSNISRTMITTHYNSPSASAISNVVNLGIALHDTYPYYTATYTGLNGNTVNKTITFIY